MALFRRNQLPPTPPLPPPEAEVEASQAKAAAEAEEARRMQRNTLSTEARASLEATGLQGFAELWRRIDTQWAEKGCTARQGQQPRIFSGIAADGNYVEVFQGDSTDSDDLTTTTFFLVHPSDPDSLREVSKTEEELGMSLDAPATVGYWAEAADGTRVSLSLPTSYYKERRPGGALYTGAVDDPYKLTMGDQSVYAMPIDRALQGLGLTTEAMRPAQYPQYEQVV